MVEIQFEEMKEMGTLEGYLKECGYSHEVNSEFMGIERRENRI